MVSIHVLATPIRGRLRSASVNPTALYMERAPARSRPSVMARLMCLRSMVKSPVKDYSSRGAGFKVSQEKASTFQGQACKDKIGGGGKIRTSTLELGVGEKWGTGLPQVPQDA